MDEYSNEMSVSDLTNRIKNLFDTNFSALKVVGEVSNFRPSSIGHWYFTLKDNNASLSVVMFKTNTWKAGKKLQDGDKIIVTGSLDVYPPRGSYQLKCENISFVGIGDILLQLEERKKLYAQAGWFDNKYKKPIIRIPKKLGIVTSPTTAALQDVLQVLDRRAPSLNVIVIPAVVQGREAGKTIAAAIDLANDYLLCDQLIVTRGGGSIEDLLPFSEDCVLRSILKSKIPIISGVGHEIDWALSDFVADLRAPTPSAAAELASSGIFEAISKNKELKTAIRQNFLAYIAFLYERVHKFDKNVLSSFVNNKIDSSQFRLANCENDIERSINFKIENINYQLMVNEKNILNSIDNNYSLIKYRFDSAENNIAQSLDNKVDTMLFNLQSFYKESKSLLINKIEISKLKTKENQKDLLRNIETQLNNKYIDMKNRKNDIVSLFQLKMDSFLNSFNITKTELKALSPKDVLQRGFSITRNKKGEIISSTKQVKKNELVEIDLYDGSISAKVE